MAEQHKYPWNSVVGLKLRAIDRENIISTQTAENGNCLDLQTKLPPFIRYDTMRHSLWIKWFGDNHFPCQQIKYENIFDSNFIRISIISNVELNIITDAKHPHIYRMETKDVQGERTNWIFMMRFESLEWIEVDLMRKIDTLFNLVHVVVCLRIQLQFNVFVSMIVQSILLGS